MTPRQQAIVDFIASRELPPTVREIGEHFEIASPNGVMCHLKALEKAGVIERGRGARDIRLVDDPMTSIRAALRAGKLVNHVFKAGGESFVIHRV